MTEKLVIVQLLFDAKSLVVCEEIKVLFFQ